MSPMSPVQETTVCKWNGLPDQLTQGQDVLSGGDSSRLCPSSKEVMGGHLVSQVC